MERHRSQPYNPNIANGFFRAGRSLTQSKRQIQDYDETAGKRRIGMDRTDRTQPVDPYKAGEKTMEIVESGDIPFRLVLGRDAVEVMEDALERRKKEFEKWKAAGQQTDFGNAL